MSNSKKKGPPSIGLAQGYGPAGPGTHPLSKSTRGRRPHGNGKSRKPKRGLTSGVLSGPPAHNEAVHKARDAERQAVRRKAAWRLFVDRGLTFEEIGKALGVSGKTAHGDVMAYKEGLADLTDAELVRARQAAGLDGIVAAHWKRRGRKANAEVILDAFQHEARLFGVNLQRKDSYTADQVLGVLRSITALFMEIVQDPDARRQFSLGLRRKVGAIAGPVVSEQGPEKKTG